MLSVLYCQWAKDDKKNLGVGRNLGLEVEGACVSDSLHGGKSLANEEHLSNINFFFTKQ